MFQFIKNIFKKWDYVYYCKTHDVTVYFLVSDKGHRKIKIESEWSYQKDMIKNTSFYKNTCNLWIKHLIDIDYKAQRKDESYIIYTKKVPEDFNQEIKKQNQGNVIPFPKK